jgi:hypothetical protein
MILFFTGSWRTRLNVFGMSYIFKDDTFEHFFMLLCYGENRGFLDTVVFVCRGGIFSLFTQMYLI